MTLEPVVVKNTIPQNTESVTGGLPQFTSPDSSTYTFTDSLRRKNEELGDLYADCLKLGSNSGSWIHS